MLQLLNKIDKLVLLSNYHHQVPKLLDPSNHVKPPLHLLPIEKHHPHTETMVKKPSRSAKATTAKQTSDKQPTAATKPLPAKQPTVKQPIRTTKQPSPVKTPSCRY